MATAGVVEVTNETGKKTSTGWYWWALFGLLLSIPILLVLNAILYVSANVPHQDEWQLAPIITDYQNGTFSLHSLWIAHNEHRQPFFRLIAIGLVMLTGYWNIAHETFTSWLLSFGTILLGGLLILRTVKGRLWQAALFTLLVTSTFSLNQYENWLWGFQLAWFLVNLSLFGTVVMLTYFPGRWYGFAGALFFAIVGAGTLLSGLMILVGIFLLLFFNRKEWPFRYAIIWGVSSAIFIAAYFIGLPRLSKSSFTTKPFDTILFAIAWMGGPFANGNFGVACVIGFVGLGLLLFLAWRLLTRREFSWQTNLPWLGILLFSLANAAATADGRAAINMNFAVISRYSTNSYLLWIAVFVLLAQEIIRLDSKSRLKKLLVYGSAVVAVLSVFQFTILATIVNNKEIVLIERFTRTTEPYLYNFGSLPNDLNTAYAYSNRKQLPDFIYAIAKSKVGLFHMTQSEYDSRFQANWDKTLKENNYTKLDYPVKGLSVMTGTDQAVTKLEIRPDGTIVTERAGNVPTHLWLTNIDSVLKYKPNWFSPLFFQAGKRPIAELQAENASFVRLVWNEKAGGDAEAIYGVRGPDGIQRFRIFLPENIIYNQLLFVVSYKNDRRLDDHFKVILYNPS